MESERACRRFPARRRRTSLHRPWHALVGAGVLGLLSPLSASAADDDTRLWTTFEIHGTLVGPVRGSLIAQPRLRDDLGELDRVLLRPSLSIPITKSVSAGLGYDAHFIDNPADATEHRIWEQLAFGTPLRSLALHHRVRLEERFLEGVSGAAVRLRYRLRASYPIADSGIDAVVSDEVFLDLNTLRGGPSAGFGENRSFAGLRAPIGTRVAFEGGYQLQYIDRKTRDQANHVLMVGVSLAVP